MQTPVIFFHKVNGFYFYGDICLYKFLFFSDTELTVDDNNLDNGDTIDPYEYDEIDNYELNVDDRLATKTANTSLDVSDGDGRLLRSPTSPRDELLEEEMAWRRKLEKAKKEEPMEYDYSDSTRLLPHEYYRDFSDGKQVRLHVGKQPIITSDGSVVKPPKERKVDAIDVVSDGR